MNLTDELALRAYAGTKYARVDLILGADTGRSGQSNYAFRILAPKTITNVTATSTNYTYKVLDGNPLNPDVKASAIDVTMSLPEQGAQISALSFDLVLDGKALSSTDGQAYVFAIRQDGPHTYRQPPTLEYVNQATYITVPATDQETWEGQREDLPTGNEFDDDSGYGYGDDAVWLRSSITQVDITLVDPITADFNAKPVYNDASFGAS